jgi:hypothetical protein
MSREDTSSDIDSQHRPGYVSLLEAHPLPLPSRGVPFGSAPFS